MDQRDPKMLQEEGKELAEGKVMRGSEGQPPSQEQVGTKSTQEGVSLSEAGTVVTNHPRPSLSTSQVLGPGDPVKDKIRLALLSTQPLSPDARVKKVGNPDKPEDADLQTLFRPVGPCPSTDSSKRDWQKQEMDMQSTRVPRASLGLRR